MIAWGVLVAFGSAFAWAGLDIVRKTLARDHGPVAIAAGLSLGLASLFGVRAAIVRPPWELSAYALPAALSIVLSIAIQISILESIRRGELSRTIPLLSLTPVATALFGLAVLGERPSATQWAGIVLVFLGAASLGVSWRGGFRFDRGSLWMLLGALCISASAPFDKLAVAASSPALHGFVQSLAAALLLLVFLRARGRLGSVAAAFRAGPAMVLAALLAFAALGLQFVAYNSVMVGVVETIKRVVGLVVALLAGGIVFRERITARTLLAVALMAAGVTLLLGGTGRG